MTKKERFLNRLAGKDVDKTPIGCTTTYGMVEVMKACGAERPLADNDPKAMAALALAGPKYLGFEWIKSMGWDITPLSEVMGCELGEAKIDLQHFIKAHPFAERDINELEVPDNLLETGRFPVYKEQIKILKDAVGDDMAIFGECEGSFTCAANLVGTEQFLKWCFKKPDDVSKVIDVTKEALLQVINWAFDQGLDYYCIAEPSSGPALMSPKMWKKFVQPMMTDICKRAKGPIVLHICANTDPIIGLMCETGVAGISIEEKANLKAAAEIANEKGVKVFGNVAAATTLFMGSPEECYKDSIASLENGTHFLTPGCGIAPGSPIENVIQLKKARDEYCK